MLDVGVCTMFACDDNVCWRGHSLLVSEMRSRWWTCGHDVEAAVGDVWGHAGMMWRQWEVMCGDMQA